MNKTECIVCVLELLKFICTVRIFIQTMSYECLIFSVHLFFFIYFHFDSVCVVGVLEIFESFGDCYNFEHATCLV